MRKVLFDPILFVVDPNGDNNYYSTVLAHSVSPNKSVFALFDFLVKFYRSNLDCSVYDGDPAIGRMVGVLRDRCNGATIEQDEDIRGNVYGIQVGLKVLLTTRPGYMRHFLTKVLQKMGSLLNGNELPGKDYVDEVLTKWYIGKLTESVTSTTSINQRSAPAHKRTTDIAFSYGKIKVEYIMDDDGEPAIRIPSIRLAERENPVLKIFSNNDMVYQRTIGIYGNDYAATSEETIIPLSDILDADFLTLYAEIMICGKGIYTSGIGLNVAALLFKDSKLQTGKTVDDYVILEVCNAKDASIALMAHKEVGLMLPCKVVVYKENSGSAISLYKPSESIKLLGFADLNDLANEVEEELIKAIDSMTSKSLNGKQST
jgi:uncharacterized protein (DUF302 family)